MQATLCLLERLGWYNFDRIQPVESQNHIGLTYTGFRVVHSFREKAPAICTSEYNTENFSAWSSLLSCVHFSSLDLLLRYGHRIQIRDTRGMSYDLAYQTSQWGNPESVKLRTVVTFTGLQRGSSVSLPTSCLNTSSQDSTLTHSLTLLSSGTLIAMKALTSCFNSSYLSFLNCKMGTMKVPTPKGQCEVK